MNNDQILTPVTTIYAICDIWSNHDVTEKFTANKLRKYRIENADKKSDDEIKKEIKEQLDNDADISVHFWEAKYIARTSEEMVNHLRAIRDGFVEKHIPGTWSGVQYSTISAYNDAICELDPSQHRVTKDEFEHRANGCSEPCYTHDTDSQLHSLIKAIVAAAIVVLIVKVIASCGE